MVVADVRAGHVLVADAGDALADLDPLHVADVAQHAVLAEVLAGQRGGRQRSRVVGRQRDQVVEDAGVARGVALEGADLLVRLARQLGAVVLDVHQVLAVEGRDVPALLRPGVVNLPAEIQGPVERRAVVVDQLGVRHLFTDAVDHAADLADVRLLGLDPDQVGAVLQRGDAVQHAAVLAGALAELEQARLEALGPQQVAVALEHHVAVLHLVVGDVLAVEEGVVQVADVARLVGDRDLLGQAGAERVGARDDDAVVDAQFEEGVTAGVDLGQEVGVRHGDLAVLVAALLLVGHLVLDLQRAGAGLDHLLGQQVGGLLVAEAGVDVGDDRHHVGLEVVDLVENRLLGGGVALRARLVEIAEQAAELTRIGLLEVSVEFLDQFGHGGLLVHRLVGQRAELGAQRGDHPARQVEVLAVGRAEVLLDGNHLLLADETVPAAQRLRVLARVGVVGGHVAAHDVGRVARDVEAGQETVLQAHARRRFRVDGAPVAAGVAADLLQGGDFFAVLQHGEPSLCCAVAWAIRCVFRRPRPHSSEAH